MHVDDLPSVSAPWPSSWTRAALELAVLAIVCRDGPTHGYDVGRRLQEGGLGRVAGGTLYPVLGRLEDQRLVRGHWVAGEGGPGRKVLEATDGGHRELRRRTADWLAWTGRVASVLAVEPSTAAGPTGSVAPR